MKLIIINGSSCSGKSSIVKSLMNSRENLFLLHYDSLKWSFSKYSREEKYKDVQKVMQSVALTVFEMGKYDVICDSGLYRVSRQNLIDIAKKLEYEIIEINLEADFNILLQRFNERVESALKVSSKDRRISNLSVDRFKELFDIYNKEKNELAISFYSDKESSEEIAEKIKMMLN